MTGSEKVRSQIKDITRSGQLRLKGEDRAIFLNVATYVQSRLNDVENTLDRLDEMGGDVLGAFWVPPMTKSSLGKGFFAEKRSLDQIYRDLIAGGWIAERRFGTKLSITLRMGS